MISGGTRRAMCFTERTEPPPTVPSPSARARLVASAATRLFFFSGLEVDDFESMEEYVFRRAWADARGVAGHDRRLDDGAGASEEPSSEEPSFFTI